MLSEKDLRQEVKGVFQTRWSRRAGRIVPDAERITLSNDSVELDATVLYADLVESTSLVDGFKDVFAAEVYKAFLVTACRVIRANDGEITAFDGDRVMAVFLGSLKNSNAAKTALQIEWALQHVVKPSMLEVYPNVSYEPRQTVGIDTSKLLVAKTGIRDANDLVWVGRAANYAAKLSALRQEGFRSFITEDVYKRLSDATKLGGSPKEEMWQRSTWHERDMVIYRSNWSWAIS